MRKLFCFISCIFFAVFLFAEDVITVAHIKVFIDNSEFSWKHRNENPVLVAGELPRVSAQTVLSFTSLQPGKKFSLKSLTKEIERATTRLNDSGLFYSATVSVVPPRKKPSERTIVIIVQSGFFWRFGGGNAYGIIGKTGIGTENLKVLGYLGWNRNGCSVWYDNAFRTPLILGGALFWNGPEPLLLDSADASDSCLDGVLTLGATIHPDVKICMDVISKYYFCNGFDSNAICISPYIIFSQPVSKTVSACSELRGYVYPCCDDEAVCKVELFASTNWTPIQLVTFALGIAGGTAIGNENHVIDSGTFLLAQNDLSIFPNNVFVNRIIRSGYDKQDLTTNKYVYGSGEVRLNVFKTIIPPAFTIRVNPFVFVDIAYWDDNIKDAFGCGARILFDNPVFAYFSFSYGINHKGDGLFSFTATKGF